MNAHLQMERADKAKLEQQLQEHRETVHQLTHHVRVLRTQLELQQEQAQLGLSGTGASPLQGTHGDYAFSGGLSYVQMHTSGATGPLPESALLDTHFAHHSLSHNRGDDQRHSTYGHHGSGPSGASHPHSHSHTHPHTVHSARQSMSAAAQHHDPSMAHLARTVPLTPASVAKGHPGSGSGSGTGLGAAALSHGYGERLNFTSPGAFHGSGTDVSVRDARAVPRYAALQPGHSHMSDVEIIRSSIPPPPWQQE